MAFLFFSFHLKNRTEKKDLLFFWVYKKSKKPFGENPTYYMDFTWSNLSAQGVIENYNHPLGPSPDPTVQYSSYPSAVPWHPLSSAQYHRSSARCHPHSSRPSRRSGAYWYFVGCSFETSRFNFSQIFEIQFFLHFFY